jgi:hypothetical protein
VHVEGPTVQRPAAAVFHNLQRGGMACGLGTLLGSNRAASLSESIKAMERLLGFLAGRHIILREIGIAQRLHEPQQRIQISVSKKVGGPCVTVFMSNDEIFRIQLPGDKLEALIYVTIMLATAV